MNVEQRLEAPAEGRNTQRGKAAKESCKQSKKTEHSTDWSLERNNNDSKKVDEDEDADAIASDVFDLEALRSIMSRSHNL